MLPVDRSTSEAKRVPAERELSIGVESRDAKITKAAATIE